MEHPGYTRMPLLRADPHDFIELNHLFKDPACKYSRVLSTRAKTSPYQLRGGVVTIQSTAHGKVHFTPSPAALCFSVCTYVCMLCFKGVRSTRFLKIL